MGNGKTVPIFIWESWDLEKHPEAIKNASDKITEMVENFRDAMEKIDKKLITQWVRNIV